jgi:hypothetical protein
MRFLPAVGECGGLSVDQASAQGRRSTANRRAHGAGAARRGQSGAGQVATSRAAPVWADEHAEDSTRTVETTGFSPMQFSSFLHALGRVRTPFLIQETVFTDLLLFLHLLTCHVTIFCLGDMSFNI